jgi:hypothetical protein
MKINSQINQALKAWNRKIIIKFLKKKQRKIRHESTLKKPSKSLIRDIRLG